MTMAIHSTKPRDLPKGVYWYMKPGKEPEICEKRDGEDFVRFTNGAHQTWLREGESFYGPLPMPEVGNQD